MFFKIEDRGAWVALLVKCWTLDLSSGLDLRVMSSSPTLGSMLGVEPALNKQTHTSWGWLRGSTLDAVVWIGLEALFHVSLILLGPAGKLGTVSWPWQKLTVVNETLNARELGS